MYNEAKIGVDVIDTPFGLKSIIETVSLLTRLELLGCDETAKMLRFQIHDGLKPRDGAGG